MKSRALTILLVLIAFCLPVHATSGGPSTIEVLGLSKKAQKLYFLRTNEDASDSLPELYSLRVGISDSPVKVKSVYAGLQEDDEDKNEKFDERIEKLKAQLNRLDSQDLKQIQLKTTVMKQGKEIILEDIEVPSWTLSFEVNAKELKSKGVITSYCNPDVKIREWIRIPNKNIAVAVISYSGIPYEGCYEVQDLVLLKAKAR